MDLSNKQIGQPAVEKNTTNKFDSLESTELDLFLKIKIKTVFVGKRKRWSRSKKDLWLHTRLGIIRY